MCDVSFSVEKGYHGYKDNWVAVVGELSCRREPTVPIVKIDLRSASGVNVSNSFSWNDGG